ncbi:MAG: formyltransferase family protein [Bacteroidia bacterium]
MKIVLLCGNQPNHIALAHKVAEKHELIGIIIEEKPATGITLFNAIPKFIDKLLFSEINNAWHRLMQHYKNNYKGFPITEIFKTSSINSARVVEIIERLKPDLAMVSGTSLIRKPLIEMKVQKGIINLHTGISPYVKGGPNCTNWCIANDEFHLIGNTIMWLDAGIDSGNLIATETVDFTGHENLFEIHLKVMENAHQLYLKAVDQIKKDSSKCPSIKQKEIGEGKLYLTKMWGFSEKKALLKNISEGRFSKIILSAEYREKKNKLKLVKISN